MLQESNLETRVHRVKGLSGLGEYGSIGYRNCIKFILGRRNNSYSKTEGKKQQMDEKIQHFRSYKGDLITGGEVVI